MKKMCVIGSFNIDIVAKTDTLPMVGETVACSAFQLLIGGGKGANQAVSAGRLGADVAMVGCLGDLFYGAEYINVLQKNHVRHDAVEVLEGEYPGRAFVVADHKADNLLFIHEGTNAKVTVDYIKKHWASIIENDIFLLQYEIPFETNLFLARELSKLGKTIVLDPAPAFEAPDELYSYIDYITPNEVELAQITGMQMENEQDVKAAAEILLDKGVKNVIAKSGKKGAYIVNNEIFQHIPAFDEILAVDTTAAGDTFNGAFAYRLSMGERPEQAVRFANAAAGLSTTKLGAQDAMPDLAQVQRLMEGAND